MYGTYFKTLSRDIYTGETTFLYAPMEKCEYAIDGLLKCKGKINFYAKKTPLCIDGVYENGIYNISEAIIDSPKRDNAIHMLGYLSVALTDHQKEKIVDLLGCNILGITNDDRTKLLDILSKSKNKIKIVDDLIKKIKILSGKQNLYNVLESYGISVDRIESVLNKNITLDDFKKRPYMTCLMNDIDIYKADMIAKDLINVNEFTYDRVKGFIVDSMQLAKKNGNTCMTFKSLCNLVNYRLKSSIYSEYRFSEFLIYYGITEMPKMYTFEHRNDEIYVFEKKILEQENETVKQIKRILESVHNDINELSIEEIENELNIKYNKGQKECFDMLKTSGIKILNGPPGSGKTAVIKGIITQYKKIFPNRIIKLAATTGAAAQVMSNACGYKAQTVNKLLDIRPYDDVRAVRNENNPIDADLVIVDEISMIGLSLFYHLLKAIKSGSTLILVGDADQFQSVDYGNVLLDLIKSGVINTYKLTEIMRQSGSICENAQYINNGYPNLIEDEKFTIVKAEDEESQLKKMLSIVEHEKNNLIISPIKMGKLGVYNLNIELQKKAKLDKKCMTYAGVSYYINDKIIMLHTDYEAGYFNGDRGVIRDYEIDNDKVVLYVDFPNKRLAITNKDFHNMMLAYSITGHKSQGAEEENVYVMLPDSSKYMLTRRYFYTAVTRAKKKVYVFTSDSAYKYAISNASERMRTTLLREKLIETINQ